MFINKKDLTISFDNQVFSYCKVLSHKNNIILNLIYFLLLTCKHKYIDNQCIHINVLS